MKDIATVSIYTDSRRFFPRYTSLSRRSICAHKDQKRQIRASEKQAETYNVCIRVFRTVPSGGRQGRQKGNAIKEIVKYTGRFILYFPSFYII